MSGGGKRLRVLFLYPNIQMRTIAPVGISIMSALLKDNDIDVDVFDCTRYEDHYVNPERDYDSSHEKFVRMNIHADRMKNSNVAPFDWRERNITLKSTDMISDLLRKIDAFSPDLVAVSLVENTFRLGMDILGALPQGLRVVCGGVFCTYAPDIVIAQEPVNFVIRGEGEFPLLDLCKAIAQGRSTDTIPNVWAKTKHGVKKNGFRAPINVDDLPTPDYGVFEEELLYTPMQGHVWRAIGFETQRGCPYTCTYCNSPSNNVLYRNEGNGAFYRKKSVSRLKKEMADIVRLYDPELIYFVADTFLAMSRRELDEFSEFYQGYKIPFWMNTRAETITQHSAAHLAKMNCLRFNIGIEHGDETFRKDVLRRSVSNQKMVDAFGIAADYADEYTCVANSIIGLPTETPELIFSTIELNRQLPSEIFAAGAFIFVPYWGTALRALAIEKGYISEDLICTDASNTTAKTFLNMPQLDDQELRGFMKTFSFYVKFPKNRWPEIDLARSGSLEGELKFAELRDEYAETFLAPMKLKTDVARLASPGQGPHRQDGGASTSTQGRSRSLRVVD